MISILFAFLIIGSNDTTTFKTGKDLEQSLATEIRWSSVGSELADQLRDLQAQSGVFILRDRQIDPHRLISVQTEFVSRAQVLRQISQTIPDGAFCLTENLAYVGTAEATHRLPILLSQRIKETDALRNKLDTASFRRLSAKIDVSWDTLSEPRQILLDHAVIAGITITNPDAIPYDLWAAGHLPRMTFTELATVILNQFDLTFELAADRPELTIVPIDPGTTLEHRYSFGSKLKPTMTTTWQQKVPDIEIRWNGPNATITATLQQHTLLYALLQEAIYTDPDSASTPGTPKKSIRTTNYQLNAKRATVGQLIDFFRSQNVTIEVIDEDSSDLKVILNETVDLDTLTQRQPGVKLFPLIFGKHFKRVDVLDDRVVLSRE